MTITIYCKADRYGEIDVVNEDGLADKIRETADNLRESDSECLEILENTGFSFRELLEANGDTLAIIREKMEEGFMTRAKEQLLEYDWNEFEIEVSENDLLDMMKSLSKDKLTELYTSVMCEK